MGTHHICCHPLGLCQRKMINTGPLSKGSKSPGTTLQGNFNHLDICWVTNTAVTWTLNYVRTALLSSRWKHTGDEVTLTWLEENSKHRHGSLGLLFAGSTGWAVLLQQGDETDLATGSMLIDDDDNNKKETKLTEKCSFLTSETEILVNDSERR